MNQVTSINSAGSNLSLNVRKTMLLAAFTFFVLIAALAIRPAHANAAYNILDYKLTPSNLQAGGHPNFHYHVDPDATTADKTGGDDLKKVVMDFPAGLLGNPEAATTKCTATQFGNDQCPSASYIGSMKVQWRETSGSFGTGNGSVYVLTPPTYGSAATIGFVVRPSGCRKIFLKTEVTGVVTVRSGTEADYGLTLAVDNIPRTLTSIFGTTRNITVSDIAVDANARANTNQTGPYFIFNPTRCTASPSKATITTYGNVTTVKTDSFTNTGCSSVPFAPTSSYAVANTNSGATTGIAATFGIPTADATIQQSHIRSIQTDLPAGTGLDFPAIGAVPGLCAEADLNADNCPANSKIGSVSAAVPFLPPTMTGDVYMLSRGTSVTFGYILRGANGVKAPLKGQVLTVDANNDGIADFVRARTDNMPQAPWSTATINFSTPLVKNPVGNCGPKTISTQITGWSGAVVNRTNTYTTTNCVIDTTPPVVNITSPADGSTVNSAMVQLNFTATDNSGSVTCTRNGSPITSGTNITLVTGPNAIQVTCTDPSGNSTTATSNVTYSIVDTTPPVISNISPTDNSTTTANSITLTYTATDNSGAAPTCTPPSGSVLPVVTGLNTFVIDCADAAGNHSQATVRVTRIATPPVVAITAPADNSNSTVTPVNAAFTVNGGSTIPAGTTCTVNGTATSSTTTNTVTLVAGPNTITVACTNADGTDTKSVTVNGVAPAVVITAPAAGNRPPGATNVSYTVNGGSTIPAGTTCTVNGNASTSTTTNSVNIVSGSNTITVVCTNVFGPTTTSVVVTGVPVPVVAITSPANGSNSTTTPINVTFTVDGGSTIPAGDTCTINGTATTTPNTNSRALVAGANTITVVCSNSSGSSTPAVITVNGVVPTVAITSPTAGTTTAATSINVAYTVNGGSTIPSGTTCTVNGSPSSSTSTNSVSLPLIGNNTITVACTNAFGAGQGSVVVVRQNVPTVSITSPANNSNSTVTPINVAFTIDGGTTVPSGGCTINGSNTTTPGTNSVPLVAGANTITVICTNASGPSAPATITVNGVAPTVAITSPTTGTNTTLASINAAFTVNGSATIPAGTTCTVNGTATSSATTNSVALTPEAATTITVVCTNAFGASTPVSVTVNRGTAPQVIISSPVSGVNTANSTFPINWTVTGTPPITCTLNGVAATPGTTTVNLVAGANTFTINCTNAFGSGSASVVINRGTPPLVTITSPANNTNTTATSINVAYTVTGTAPITCTVNGVTSTTPATNNVALVAGPNTITVACTNVYGSDSKVITVNQGTAPVVTISSPANNTNTTATSINVAYSTTGTPPVTCTVNGVTSTTPATNNVNLVVGSNSIVVACSNAFGSDSKSVTVNRGNPPVVVVTSPPNNTNTSASSINVAYTVDGSTTLAAGTTCTVNGVASSGGVTNSAALALGSNTLTVSCSNVFGSGSNAVTVVRGNPPVVVITAPADNSSTVATSTNLIYTVDGTSTVPSGGCTINGTANTTPAGTSVALSPGLNTITVLCTNAFGTSTPAVVHVTSGNTPAAAITSPANGFNTTASSVNVTYTVNGASTIPAGTTCTINGAPTTTPNTNNINLVAGPNPISVVCQNSFGTGNTATITVNQGTAPVVTITSPANNSNSAVTPINVAYTVTGSAPITCTVNGVTSTTPATNSVTLVLGANTITVSCSNAFGSNSQVITVNGVKRTVAITSPANNTNTSATSINVAYTVDGATTIPSGTTCTVNGVASTTPSTNSVALSLGANTINVVCNSAFGASNTATVTVNRGNPPVAAITSPADNSNSTVTPINVSYTVDGSTTMPASTTCTINGTNTTTPSTNSRALVAGPNTISVVCTNQFGTGNTATITVNGVVPTVALTSPTGSNFAPNQVLNVAFTVNGAASIPAGTTCTVNGTSTSSATTNTFTAPSSGNFTISVVCTNAFGASTAATLSGTIVPVPVVVITSPANNSNSTTTPINVSFTVDGGTTIPSGGCTINGVSTSSATTNSRALVAGANTITVICSNSSGSSAPATITVNGVVPTVALTSPTGGPSFLPGTVLNVAFTVNGAASIPAGTTCTVNGTSTSSATTNSFTVPTGAFTITVVCTNAFGASPAATFNGTGLPVPVVAITAPANNSNSTTTPINVAFTVNGVASIPSGTTCTVNGVSTSSATTNSRALVAGANTITVVCTNASGSSTPASVIVNGVVPTVALTSPTGGPSFLPGTVLNVAFTVNGAASIPAGTTCTVNGTSTSSATTNSFTVPTGAFTISVVCTNAFGSSPAATFSGTGLPVPVVAITAPANNSNSTTTPINVAFTVNGVASIPGGTTCTVNGVSTSSATTNSRTLVAGANTITVVCTNASGSSTPASVIVNGVTPTVVMTTPSADFTAPIGTTTTNVAYTVNGGTTIPAGTTCSIANSLGGTTASSTGTANTVPVVVGANSLTVSCTNAFGTATSAPPRVVTVPPNATRPNTTITTFAAPSNPSVTTPARPALPAVSFTTDTGTSFECRMNSQPFASCSSAWTLPLGGAGIVTGENTYEIRAVNAAGPDLTPAKGFIWVDDRTYTAIPTVAPHANTLVPTDNDANDAGAHPDVSASLDLQGYDDPQSVSIKFPDGLEGSLKAIPAANRCSVAQASAGTCPAASAIGTITGTAESPTDGLVTANGTLYLVGADAGGLDPQYAAGVAAKFSNITGPVTGNLGDIYAQGGLRLTEQARNLTTDINNIPRTTTTGKPFHITSVSLNIKGDTGGAANPLITNPHFCNDAAEVFDARPDYFRFVGQGSGYDGLVTPVITADYVVDNCVSVPFNPAISLSLTNPAAAGTVANPSGSTGLDANVTLPPNNSTLRGLVVTLPSFVSLNFPSFGISSDMCNGADDGSGTANDVSPPGTTPSYYSFDASSCPSQAQIGTATITTPLLDNPVTGNVYLIDKSPVPWIGIQVDPSIPGNPQGVTLGLVGFNATVNEIPSCTTSCQQVVQSTFTSVPDVPVSSVALHLGGITGRISNATGNPVLNPNILNMAGPNSNTCKNSGTFAQAVFNPWTGTSAATIAAPLSATNCNDPKINITTPAAAANTGGRQVNVPLATTTQNVAFTINGSNTIPAGVTCTVNGVATSSTTTNSVALAVGVNSMDVVCTDAFGQGTASRRVDRGIPSVFITTPAQTVSTNTGTSQNIAYGLTNNGAVTTSLTGLTCTIKNLLTNVTTNSTSVTTNAVAIVSGANQIQVTCSNANGPGLSQIVTVNKP